MIAFATIILGLTATMFDEYAIDWARDRCWVLLWRGADFWMSDNGEIIAT